MSVFPIAIRKKSMLHQQGTKEYHQVLVVTGDNRGMLMQRWGKKGAWGQMSTEVFRDVGQATAAFENKDREKRSGRSGYRHDPARDTIVECNDEAEFRAKLGRQYFFQAGANNLDFIVPGIDTTGVETVTPAEFEEVAPGRVVKKGYQPKHEFKDFVEPPKPTVEDQIAENPNWGMF